LLYFTQGNFPEAEKFYLRGTQVLEQSTGPKDEAVAQALLQLGRTQAQQQGKYNEAQKSYLRSIELIEKVRGREDPSLAPLLEEYGGLLTKMGRTAEAQTVTQRGKTLRGS
jgi:tetratricopeptide (TPR) repeat protein